TSPPPNSKDVSRRRDRGGEDQHRFDCAVADLEKQIALLRGRLFRLPSHGLETLDLCLDLRGLDSRLRRREEFPEEDLLHGVRALFVAECAPVLALRQGAAAAQTVESTPVETQL